MAYMLKPVDDAFFQDAPIVIPASVDLAATADQVWAALGSDSMWSWAPIIDQVRWASPAPLAAGAIRMLRLFKAVTLEEEFYRWDVGRRATFRVTRQSRRLYHGLAEDFLLEPAVGGGTRLTWTMAIAPRGLPAPPKVLIPALSRGNALALSGIKKIL